MPALPTFAIFEEEYSVSKKPEQINSTPSVSEKMRQSMEEEGEVRDTDIRRKRLHSQCT